MSQMPHDQTEASHGRPDWGALIFACLLAVAVLVFAWSVVSTARRTTDWLLIAPGAMIAAFAFIYAGIVDLRIKRHVADLAVKARSEAAQPVILIGLTCVFAGAAPFIGFDLGSGIFILLCLLVQGERCWWKLALASIGGAAVMSWVFVDLLMVRLPVIFL
ncbi:Tripartite tricarboxylate transporter TctB family protein [Sulfitobacter brevis]|uniref:Tripartite tricarboxylate transporter TctB family protein n=1 Tax=Sulfitobacter brevis TaxID=74348 RepID=A0A1I1WLI0_9RHOB|nr:tripartite tricarboxylate transporter TctB family protein [Sulfitobacter brevis]SFD95942.1 Tripartite tricarboxylate transporter TctB family protein [Sulfitobacter brevis]